MKDKTMFGFSLFALALAMLSISMQSLQSAGFSIPENAYLFIGIVAGISMVAFLILGAIVILQKN